ncbi:MAG TPA: arabinan endo-1,5-alpha-L-arabinosidase [Candidatus Limnocylindrales bacterium]|nr:arabinan endo-1,5-alpha-L-arabinosidase [Candidatus Limnocylindrales bacterium]
MKPVRHYSEGFKRAIIALALTSGILFPAQTGWAQTQSGANTNELAQFGNCDVRVHDPSAILKCKEEYWVFYTGRGIPSYHSKDMVKWEHGPSVFTNAPAWTARAVPRNHWIYYWAPDIIHPGDRYLLYYAVSSFGRNDSAIGLATNPTLDPADPKFKWSDQGLVVQSTSNDDFNAIDPAACLDANGHLWLAFGSFWSGIKMVQLDPGTGKRLATNSPMYSLAFNDSIEASYIYHHDDDYYLFVNWGLCCRGTNSTYEIRVGRSPKITGPYLDKSGADLITGGGSSFLSTSGPFIGPGQSGIYSENGTDWFSCHFYNGTRHGQSMLAILPLNWSTDGWPEINWRKLEEKR